MFFHFISIASFWGIYKFSIYGSRQKWKLNDQTWIGLHSQKLDLQEGDLQQPTNHMLGNNFIHQEMPQHGITCSNSWALKNVKFTFMIMIKQSHKFPNRQKYNLRWRSVLVCPCLSWSVLVCPELFKSYKWIGWTGLDVRVRIHKWLS